MATAASHGHATGARCGTSYAYTPAECLKLMGRSNFRFRNDEMRAVFFAWQEEQIEEMKASTAKAFPRTDSLAYRG